MTIHAVSTPLSTAIVAVLALAGIAAIIVWPIWRHTKRTSAVTPPPSRTSGPLPAAGEIDGDYAARFHAHQECDVWPCRHTDPDDPSAARRDRHCRCGNPWPCGYAGLLNPEPHFADDAANLRDDRQRIGGDFRRGLRRLAEEYDRNPSETGRWDR